MGLGLVLSNYIDRRKQTVVGGPHVQKNAFVQRAGKGMEAMPSVCSDQLVKGFCSDAPIE